MWSHSALKFLILPYQPAPEMVNSCMPEGKKTGFSSSPKARPMALMRLNSPHLSLCFGQTHLCQSRW